MISNDIFQVNVNNLLIQQNCTISSDLLMLVTLYSSNFNNHPRKAVLLI